MINTIHPPDIYVKDTGTEKGRGAFAARRFDKGEVVEECPVIILYKPFEELAPKIRRIVYNWGNLTKTAPSNALVIGYGSMYNHDNPANMKYNAELERETIVFTAVRDIEKDEELTINYNSDSGSNISHEDIWFKSHNIKPI